MKEEFLDIVNEENKVVGKTTRKEVYEKKLNHRIVHVFVIDPDTNKIYLQKRSNNLAYLPGYYCTSAGGHVLSGESYEQAAIRELKEEIGVSASVRKIAEVKFESGSHKRFIELFVAFANFGFNFKDGEVSDGKFFDLQEVKNLIERDEKIHPQLKVCFEELNTMHR